MDRIPPEKRSEIMSAIRSKHTQPEIMVRKALRKAGYEYRLHYGKEKIDIALTSERVAIFVDGCFWHQCPKHSHIPKSNRAYWVPKLRKNVQRTKDKDKRLRENGWKVVHIWEHDTEILAGPETKKAIEKLALKLRKRIYR